MGKKINLDKIKNVFFQFVTLPTFIKSDHSLTNTLDLIIAENQHQHQFHWAPLLSLMSHLIGAFGWNWTRTEQHHLENFITNEQISPA